MRVLQLLILVGFISMVVPLTKTAIYKKDALLRKMKKREAVSNEYDDDYDDDDDSDYYTQKSDASKGDVEEEEEVYHDDYLEVTSKHGTFLLKISATPIPTDKIGVKSLKRDNKKLATNSPWTTTVSSPASGVRDGGLKTNNDKKTSPIAVGGGANWTNGNAAISVVIVVISLFCQFGEQW